MTDSVEPAPTPAEKSSGYGLTLLALTIGGGGALWSLTQPWASETVSNGFTTESVDVSGAALYPVGLAGAWLALASVVGVVATSGRARQVFGVVVLGSAAAVLAAPLLYLLLDQIVVGADTSQTRDALGASPTKTLWWVVTMLCGFAIAASGIFTMLRGAGWRRLSARQDGQKQKSDVSDWDALDQGNDPTV